MSVVADLGRVLERIAEPSRWTKGSTWRFEEGVRPLNVDTCPVCLLGAAYWVASGSPVPSIEAVQESRSIVYALQHALAQRSDVPNWSDIAGWQDHPDRVHDDVLVLVHSAIALAAEVDS